MSERGESFRLLVVQLSSCLVAEKSMGIVFMYCTQGQNARSQQFGDTKVIVSSLLFSSLYSVLHPEYLTFRIRANSQQEMESVKFNVNFAALPAHTIPVNKLQILPSMGCHSIYNWFQFIGIYFSPGPNFGILILLIQC